MEVTCLILVLVMIWKKCHQIWYMRNQWAGRWDAIPKITSPIKSMFHKKGGGNREGSGTFVSDINCQGVEN